MKIIFLISILLSCNTVLLSQSVTRDTKPSFLRTLGEADIPKFRDALPYFDCKTGYNFTFNEIPFLNAPSSKSQIRITEHLNYFPKTGLSAELYFMLADGRIVHMNLCEDWEGFVFNEDGSLNAMLNYAVDTFFVFSSLEETNCEVVVWFQPTHIPMGRKGILKCFY